MRKQLLMPIAAVCALSASALVYDTIILTDGTKMDGYISGQQGENLYFCCAETDSTDENTASLKWDDVTMLMRAPEMRTIREIFITDDTVYSGFIIDNTPADRVTLDTDRGVVDIAWDDVVINKRESAVPGHDIGQVSPLITTYFFNGVPPVDGVLIENNYADDTLTIFVPTTGKTVTVDASKFLSLSSRPNHAAAPFIKKAARTGGALDRMKDRLKHSLRNAQIEDTIIPVYEEVDTAVEVIEAVGFVEADSVALD